MATAINSANPVFINCENSKNAINSAVLPRHVLRRCIYDASVNIIYKYSEEIKTKITFLVNKKNLGFPSVPKQQFWPASYESRNEELYVANCKRRL